MSRANLYRRGLAWVVVASFPVAFLLACESGTDSDPIVNGKGKTRLDTTFYANGKVGSIRTFKDTVRHGVSIFWYESGVLASVSHHKDDIRQGWGFGWHAIGGKSSENFSQAGEVICYTGWDESGAVIEQKPCTAALYSDSTYTDWKKLAGVP